MTPQETHAAITAALASVMRGQERAVRLLLAALASGGHVLLEDYPGTGKTTLAKALAQTIRADFRRLQFTPDLLPSDILGVSIYNQRDQTFQFHPGPVFTHILLADEINRASPRTQSALLEAMAESQVTVEGQSRPLADPFFVIATQNPVEMRGTYPLPEAQMDRFALQFTLGYVSAEDEMAILDAQRVGHPLDGLTPRATLEDIRQLQRAVREIRLTDAIRRYIVTLVGATRQLPGVQLAASPRASLALMRGAQALALFAGREFVIPDDVQELAGPVIAHRLVLDPQAKFSGLTPLGLVEDILRKIPAPE